jgi:formylmethanofuran dehydrogenase subunit C
VSDVISLFALKEFQFPIVASCISPDVFDGKTCEEIAQLQIWEGNKQKKLNELFKIAEAKTDSETDRIVIQGNLDEVRGIGSRMTKGEITIQGNGGMHVGEEMKGGKITVKGDVGGWTGSMMKGGTIMIRGNAGDYLAAPYRGSSQGMTGGQITVHGNVGNEAGAHIKKGLIRIYGNVGQFIGFRMREGTIYVQGDCAGRAGACMVNGKIIIGGSLEFVLPTFTIDSVRNKVKVEGDESVEGPFYVFIGDLAETGYGKLYVRKEKNPHLGSYESLL